MSNAQAFFEAKLKVAETAYDNAAQALALATREGRDPPELWATYRAAYREVYRVKAVYEP